MTRIILALALLATSACVATDPYGGGGGTTAGLPVHPDPLCFYEEPYEPGGPLGEVCA